ncbi:alpha/beta fold hydrolase [Elongatibacter sediminis]|uniref:Alpha/beta fold hydrolase n=1 Tax=Elongatibacter sediminis TaxID=3119006 RepID=A0AAW9RD70_9GAMM
MPEVTANGVRFHVQWLGAGPRTVVFLHGLVMDNLSSWYFTAANRVARHCRVMLYDLRGHGRSERPREGYRVEDMVDDLAALLDASGIDSPVALVGNSFGGLLALAFAARHPERVGRITLIDAHVSAAGWGEEMAATLSLQGEERDRLIAESFKDWLGRHQERKRNRLAENARELVYETRLVEDLRRSKPLDDSDLKAIDCPILALYGTESDVLDHGERLRRNAPRCELRLLPGCTHSVLWEATQEVVGTIEAFHAPRRFLFVVPPLTGHINPTMPIALELERRGHAVAWAVHPGAAKGRLPGAAKILPLDDDLPGGMQDEFLQRARQLRGPARLKFLFEDFFVPLARAMRPQVEAAIEEWNPDVIVSDQQALAGGLAARRLGLPWASLSTTSATLTDPFAGLPRVAEWLQELMAELQREAELEPVADPQLSPRLALVLSASELVGPDQEYPGSVRFVGPALGHRPGVEFPWDWLQSGSRKLLISLGTINADLGRRFYAEAMQALEGCDVQVIVAAPADLLPEPPPNFLVRDFVPQLELLPRLDAVLCHAGHNTVAESLAHGVPLVVAPIKDDQPVVAQQVVRAGAGVQIKFGRVRAAGIRAAVERVLDDPDYTDAAVRVGAAFRQAGGPVRAADLLEMLD